VSPKDDTPTEEDAGDELVVPDEVLDPGEDPDGAPDGETPGAVPARRDRKPLYALITGLAACWFTVFGPLLAMLLAPAAIILGRLALKRVDNEGGTPNERKQAKIGFIAGLLAAAFILVQIVIFQIVFEWEKSSPPLEDDKSTTTSEPGPPATTAPLG
jgi:hypothetical protein